MRVHSFTYTQQNPTNTGSVVTEIHPLNFKTQSEMQQVLFSRTQRIQPNASFFIHGYEIAIDENSTHEFKVSLFWCLLFFRFVFLWFVCFFWKRKKRAHLKKQWKNITKMTHKTQQAKVNGDVGLILKEAQSYLCAFANNKDMLFFFFNFFFFDFCCFCFLLCLQINMYPPSSLLSLSLSLFLSL